MKKLHYAIGLPRSGSTLLMNILQQHPLLFTSSTCPTPYLLDSVKHSSNNVAEFVAMEQDVLNDCLTSFVKNGIDGWYSALTNKENVISKSRPWSTYLNFIFHAYENPKIIVTLRDLRDIVCSYEKLKNKYNFYDITFDGRPFNTIPFEKRIEVYCTDISGNLGKPLQELPHVIEWMQKKPNNFFVVRFEDFNKSPVQILDQLLDFLELPKFNFNFNNIDQAVQYEHDTAYRALTSHKTEKQLKPLKPSWPSVMNKNHSDNIIKYNDWYYQIFYPEIYNDYISNRNSTS